MVNGRLLLISRVVLLESYYNTLTFLKMASSSCRSKTSVKCRKQSTVHLENLCSLDVSQTPCTFRKTGIICTIGPASRKVEVLQKMIEAGMTIARLNFSHGDHKYHRETVEAVRTAIQKMSVQPHVAIALDTKGPEIRTGNIAIGVSQEVALVKGDRITLSTNIDDLNKCSNKLLYVDYKNITKVLSVGSWIFVDDGLICLKVEKIDDDSMICTIENGGMLGSKKGINLPGTKVDLPAVSTKDIEDLSFCVQKELDMIFASFIRNADGIRTIRRHLGPNGKHIKIIAKIENQEGIDNIDEIIREADGVMVARGDLGTEIPAEKIFLVQKMMIAKCNVLGKTAICATQMLESMTKKPRPTRAEGTDVANAVLDGADCVMLSGETAKGDYPIECVQMMNSFCLEAEKIFDRQRYFFDLHLLTEKPTDLYNSTAAAAICASNNCCARTIVIFGPKLAHSISKYRPCCPLVLITDCEIAARQSQLYSGIFPFVSKDLAQTLDEQVKLGIKIAKSNLFVRVGENVIVAAANARETFFAVPIQISD